MEGVKPQALVSNNMSLLSTRMHTYIYVDTEDQLMETRTCVLIT